MKVSPQLSISYGDYCLYQQKIIEYFGYYLDSNLNGDSMARRVLKNINTKLNFIWRQKQLFDLFV